jgi:hypothetical protein
MAQSSNFIYEKRLVNRLKGYWDRINDENDVPLSSKFNGGSISDMWESCLTFKVTYAGNTKIYHCDHVGRMLQDGFGKDLKGRYFSSYDMNRSISRDFVQILDKVIESRQFVVSQGQFVNFRDKIVKFRDCIMPFKDFSGNVKLIVVGVSWRSFD